MQPPSSASGDSRSAGTRNWIIGLILALAIAWTLRSAMMATLPIAVALLLALAVAPIDQWVRHRVPGKFSWLGHLAAILVLIAFLALFIAGIALAADEVAEGAPRYIPELRRQFEASPLAPMLGGGSDQLSSILRNVASYASTALQMLWSVVGGVVLILFLVLLMLIEAPVWRAKLGTVDPENRKWERSGSVIGRQFRRYFLARLLLGSITAALYMAWLALFGIDFILVWGLLAVLLNFIPTVGSLIAGVLPVLFAFAQRDPGTALLIAGGLLVIEQIMGNFVDPRLLGRRLSVSPLVILISLMVWGWIWGIAGALIAVPMTVLLTVVFAQIPALRPIALFLSNVRDMDALEEKTTPKGDTA